MIGRGHSRNWWSSLRKMKKIQQFSQVRQIDLKICVYSFFLTVCTFGVTSFERGRKTLNLFARLKSLPSKLFTSETPGTNSQTK